MYGHESVETMRDLQRELRRGTLELLLLRLLADEPTYGYELVKRLRTRGGSGFEVQEGTLYPILYRLEEAGWIVPEWTRPGSDADPAEAPARGVPRKVYRLSSAGGERLEELTAAWRGLARAVESILAGRPARPASEEEER